MRRTTAHFATAVLAAQMMVLAASPAFGQEPAAEPPGVDSVVEEFVRNHNYLLSAEQLKTLDELYRASRDAGDQARREPDPARKQEAREKRAAAIRQMVAVLDGVKSAHAVTLADKEVLPSIGPVHLPADIGAVLLKVEMPGAPADAEPVRGLVKPLDFSLTEGEVVRIPIDLVPARTTYLLVVMSHVPKARTTQRLDLKVGDKTYRIPIDFVTPAAGRLKLTVLSADTGEPTPAMLHLRWKFNNTTRKPANAIEIHEQFDSQGRRTCERELIVPGPVNTRYYCIPGPLDMELPAGEWEVIVRRGIEHVPVFDSFTVEPNGVVAKVYKPRRWVDMRQLGWYSGDDHVHCRILSDTDADHLMAYARAEDVHLVNVVKMGDVFRTWFDQRGFGPEYRVILGDTVLSPGQECPRTHQQIGHTLSMNTRRMVRDTDKYYLYDWVFDQVHAEGGLSGYAHVNSDNFFVHRDMAINIPKGKIDFAEVLQFAHMGVDIWYRFLNAGFKLTASAGSDIPWGGSMGEVRVYSYVGDRPFNADAWFDGLQKGHTFVTNSPMIEFTVDEALPGDEVVVKENRKLRVRARTWGEPGHFTPAKLEIVVHGQPFKVVEAGGENQRELSCDFEIDAGNGFWIAAHAVGNHGEHAHTSPVYVIREGLRFWKYEDAGKLIDQGLSWLDEIEKIVAEATGAHEEGRSADERPIDQLALQGPELLKRVADARKIWESLRSVAEKEGPIRAANK